MDWELIYQELGRHLFQSSIMPMIMIDTNGIIVKVNAAYEQWCGMSASELLGAYMPDKIENCRTHIVARTGVAELHMPQDVFGKTILSNRIPIFDGSGKLIGAWGAVEMNDYGEIVELQKQLSKMERRANKYENELQGYKQGKYTCKDILGQSEQILLAKKDALTAANAQVDVIIRGETGVGKELFAHAIHNAGSRAGGPFVSINCSALSPNLVESELFGYEGGSFTDADRRGREGKFEQANGGTLFLDEIGDMPLSIQPKLLRSIEAREITRVGGRSALPLDIQIIAATNVNLEEMVDRGVFRRDLYYRLSAYVVNVPPLRARRGDILFLAEHFARKTARMSGKPLKDFSEESRHAMLAYDWPGNVRELSNYVRNMVIRSRSEDIHFAPMPFLQGTQVPYTGDKAEPRLSDSIADYEKRALVQALQQTRGNISKTADIMKMDRNTIYRKMKKYELTKEEFK